MTCDHLDGAHADVAARTAVCLQCEEHGWESVALRLCLDCGHVGCCDSSRGRHAREHFTDTGHPVMRSYEPGQDWRWCYVDELLG